MNYDMISSSSVAVLWIFSKVVIIKLKLYKFNKNITSYIDIKKKSKYIKFYNSIFLVFLFSYFKIVT